MATVPNLSLRVIAGVLALSGAIGCTPATQDAAPIAAAHPASAASAPAPTAVQMLQAHLAKRYPAEITLSQPVLRLDSAGWSARDYEGPPEIVAAFRRAEAAVAVASGAAVDVKGSLTDHVFGTIRRDQSGMATEAIARSLSGKPAAAASTYLKEWHAGAVTKQSMLAWLGAADEMSPAAFSEGLQYLLQDCGAELERNSFTLLAKLGMLEATTRPILLAANFSGPAVRVLDRGDRPSSRAAGSKPNPDLVHAVAAAQDEVAAYVKRATNFSIGPKGEFESTAEYAAREAAAKAAADDALKHLEPELQQMFTSALTRNMNARFAWALANLTYDADKELFSGVLRLDRGSGVNEPGPTAIVKVSFPAPRADAPEIKSDLLNARPYMVWNAPADGNMTLKWIGLHGSTYTVATTVDHDSDVGVSRSGLQRSLDLYDAANREVAEKQRVAAEQRRMADEKAELERAARRQAEERRLASATSRSGTSSHKESAMETCKNAKFTACLVNSDGATCRDVATEPIGSVLRAGNYSIESATVDSPSRCTLTLNISGSVNGNSYSRRAQVWAYY